MTEATNRLDALHQWLYSCRKYGPWTVGEIWTELETLRAGGVPLHNLPHARGEIQQLLEALLIAGKATRDKDGKWLWSEVRKHDKQERLFA